MKCTAHGILYHHFWGDYSAEIYLDFKTTWQAEQAAKFLGPGWIFKNCSCGIHAKDPELSGIEDKLISLGADATKISSVATSIDHGEPFEVTLELEDPNQTELAL